jgi:hypothetical protein
MPNPGLPADVKAKARELRAAGRSIREISEALGISYGAIENHTRGYAPPESQKSRPLEPGFVEREDGTAFFSAVSDTPIKTVDEAIAATGIDTTTYTIVEVETKTWTTTAKVRAGDHDDIVIKQNYGVRIKAKRIVSRHLQAALDAIYNRLASKAPKYPEPKLVSKKNAERFLTVVGLFDAHFGKLAWGAETGHNYDLSTAERLYRNAVDDMIGESEGRKVGRFLLPIGNDFFHVDNSRNTTYAGTPQDVDGRYAKLIEAGEMAVVWAVETLLNIAPVDVVWVPGNHDPTTSYHLARTVAAWFRAAKAVTVDYSPSPRKYVRHGCTLIGMTHGSEEKPQSLPALMATERPDDWAAATCREWLLGHHHRSRQWQTQPVDTHDGTVVRVLRSIAGTDAWHHRRGYVGTTRAAEVYWYGERRGYAGHAVVPVRDA